MPVPTRVVDLALFGQAGQPAGEPGDDAVLPAAQGVEVDGGGGEGQPGVGHLLGFGDHLGGVQQRLGRDAADVEAHPAQRAAGVDHDDLACRGRRRGTRRCSRPARRRAPGPRRARRPWSRCTGRARPTGAAARSWPDGGARRRPVPRRRRQLLLRACPVPATPHRPRCPAGWLVTDSFGAAPHPAAPATSTVPITVPSRHRVTDRQGQRDDRPGDRRRHVEGGLVALQGQQRVFGRHGVARGDEDLDDRDVGEVADVRDADLLRGHAALLPGGRGCGANGQRSRRRSSSSR